jgi:hypothetical protein
MGQSYGLTPFYIQRVHPVVEDRPPKREKGASPQFGITLILKTRRCYDRPNVQPIFSFPGLTPSRKRRVAIEQRVRSVHRHVGRQG